MKYKTVTVREGERTGDIDWQEFDWSSSTGMSQDHIDHCKEMLSTLWFGLLSKETWEATSAGGWPRVGWAKVIDVGMYDGWPHWRPTPAYLDSKGQWNHWYMLSEVRKRD